MDKDYFDFHGTRVYKKSPDNTHWIKAIHFAVLSETNGNKTIYRALACWEPSIPGRWVWQLVGDRYDKNGKCLNCNYVDLDILQHDSFEDAEKHIEKRITGLCSPVLRRKLLERVEVIYTEPGKGWKTPI